MSYVFPESNIDASGYAGKSFASSYLLYNQLIPLAIIVLIEIKKLVYSSLIENDHELFSDDELTQTRV